jgi:cysteine desulfurase
MEPEGARLRILRDRLRERILAEVDETTVNGPDVERLPGNLNLAFGYVEAESLLMALADDVALSSGSACTSATLEPSHVLKAIGVPDVLAHGSIRFGLGRWNTVVEVDTVAARVTAEVARLRALSPLYGVKRPRPEEKESQSP